MPCDCRAFLLPYFTSSCSLGALGSLLPVPETPAPTHAAVFMLSGATRGLVQHHSPLSPQQQACSASLWFATTERSHLKTQPCPCPSSPQPFSLLLDQQGFRTPRPSRNPRSGLPELPSLARCCCFGPADKRSQCQGLPACRDRTRNCGREN